VRTVGTGQAAAFTYDLAKSVVATRQGNIAWAGLNRDEFAVGPNPDPVVRSNDLSRAPRPGAAMTDGLGGVDHARHRAPRFSGFGLLRGAPRAGAAELWVQHSDRLARGDGLAADHLAEVFFEMRRAGVVLRSVQDDSTFTNPMLVAAIGERNREDSARKSAATRSGKRRRWESGKAVGGPVHDGYMLVSELDAQGQPATERDGRVVYRRVIDPERAPAIRRIFDQVEAGQTFGDVARAFNAEGHKTVRGKHWTTRRIRETVLNPYYAGWLTAYGERIAGDHEPLIEPERWEQIIAGLRRLDPVAEQRRRGGRRPAEDYLLRRIGFCGHCGQSLYTRRLAGGRQYICAAVRESRGTCTPQQSLPTSPRLRYSRGCRRSLVTSSSGSSAARPTPTASANCSPALFRTSAPSSPRRTAASSGLGHSTTDFSTRATSSSEPAPYAK
jgi:DNA invertase Pin-like site-specific DNA recombinase